VTTVAPALCAAALWGTGEFLGGVGAFDAFASALIELAAARGSIGIVAGFSSLYPIATILLARAILNERLGATRIVGGLVALGGAALIAAG